MATAVRAAPFRPASWLGGAGCGGRWEGAGPGPGRAGERWHLAARAMSKRKEVEDAQHVAARSKKAAGVADVVNPKRLQVLKEGDVGQGPVIYW